MTVLAQEEPAVSDAQLQQAGIKISYQLRDRFGISDSVKLTAMAAQLLSSFVSDEQAQNQWNGALKSVSESADNGAFTYINSSALAGQILVSHTNGMTLNKWRLVRLPKALDLSDLKIELTQAETFNVYLRLAHYWYLILQTAAANDNLEWFESLLLEQAPEVTVLDAYSKETELAAALQFVTQPNGLSLTELLLQTDQQVWPVDDLATALLRMYYNRQSDHVLATVYDWIDVYQQLEFSQQLIPAAQQSKLVQLIEVYGLWYVTQSDRLQILDVQIKPLLDALFSGLEQKLKNPDHINIQTNQQIIAFITGIQDIEAYLKQPFRRDLHRALEVCFNISEEYPPLPQQPIDKNQLIGCVNDIVSWGSEAAKSPDLSGSATTLTATQPIARALQVPAWQLVNTLKYSHDTGICAAQNTVANPLEWLLAGESLLWMHDRWPALFRESRVNAQIQQLLSTGRQLQLDIDCPQALGELQQNYLELVEYWNKVRSEVQNFSNRYATSRIKKDHNIDFFQSTNQFTALKAESYEIGPCNGGSVCGAQISLPTSSELLNQFPNYIRQSVVLELGELNICYDEVEWLDRETVSTDLRNTKIANFQGRLSMKLRGFYNDQLVFDKQVSSSQTYNYLFGENSEAVLAMACPLSIVGDQIETKLERGTFGLFPNRLTFLTANRVDINQIIRNNWESGDEWLLKLSNENASELLQFNDLPEVETAVNTHYVRLGNELQQMVYQQLMEDKLRRYNSSSLTAAMLDYMVRRELFAALMKTIYPDQYHQSETLRKALSGENRIPDVVVMQENFQKRVDVQAALNDFDARIDAHKDVWELPVNDRQYSFLQPTLNKLKALFSADP
ncbi:hypothetical protein [Marinicella sp. W31]|uniref:hypothetical protein n=1 Tax=Marinicella sp. W31 TaxID=3023713 RepID=UPI00375764C6